MGILVVGIDYSITSPGIVIFGVNDKWHREFVSFRGFSEVKKNADAQRELIHYKKAHFSSEQERFDFMSSQVIEFIEQNRKGEDVYVAIEGYALGAKGLVFNIAEATGLVKHKLWDSGYHLRIYEPSLIKKYATGKGNSDKVSMGDAFEAEEDLYKPTISSDLSDYDSPKADLVDAYWIAILLYNEMLLRYGVRTLSTYNTKQIEVFNATSDKKKENVLCREFVHKLLVPSK